MDVQIRTIRAAQGYTFSFRLGSCLTAQICGRRALVSSSDDTGANDSLSSKEPGVNVDEMCMAPTPPSSRRPRPGGLVDAESNVSSESSPRPVMRNANASQIGCRRSVAIMEVMALARPRLERSGRRMASLGSMGFMKRERKLQSSAQRVLLFRKQLQMRCATTLGRARELEARRRRQPRCGAA